ncbi:MAG: hypothetical protein WAR80_15590 [Ferruginibacter sp.]
MNLSKFIIVCLLFIFGCTTQKSSDNKNSSTTLDVSKDSLRIKLIEADTVLIVGHLGRMFKEPGHNDSLPPIPSILINGRPNLSIIKKQTVITGLDLDTLINILTKPVTEITGPAMCIFDPHHTIFIIKNGETSFIDVCFNCEQFEASDNLKSFIDFNTNKWSELDTFFIQKGVRFYQKYDYQK